MKRTIERIAAVLMILAGLAVAAGYLVALLLADDRADIVTGWGALASYAVAGILMGAGWLAVSRATGQGRAPWLRIPSFSVGLALFAATVTAGFAIAIWDAGAVFVPLLAALAFVGVALVFLRLGVYWVTGRRIAADELVYPGLWGAIAAPLLLLPAQALAAGGLIASALAGANVGAADTFNDRNLGDRIQEWMESGGNGATTSLPDVLTTPTGAFGLFAMLAIIAPFTEELIKALGALFLLNRRPVVTERAAFLAAVSAGLGFAVVEGLGYALLEPFSWHQMALIRAPVVIIHVAATTIVVLGWQRMRQRGGYGLLWYYLVAVGLHAAWNGLFAAAVLTVADVGDAIEPGAGESVALLGIVAGLVVTLLAATVWMVLNARRIGRDESSSAGEIEWQTAGDQLTGYPRAGVPAS